MGGGGVVCCLHIYLFLPENNKYVYLMSHRTLISFRIESVNLNNCHFQPFKSVSPHIQVVH